MIEVASSEMNSNMTYEFHAQNILALSKLKELGVSILEYPQEIIEAGKKSLAQVLEEQSAQNEDFKDVYESIKSYLDLSQEWDKVSLKYFLNQR
jgi:TRAP-type mannitol/chloroaromatic compound transport system substrate-binding protein